jgi:heterotetrameric sarcosine oxidase gamma subunit
LHDPGLEEFVAGLVGDGSAEKPGGVSAISGDTPSLVCRLTKRTLLVLASTIRGVGSAVGSSPNARDLTMALVGLHLVGPRVESLLRRLTAFDVSPTSLPPGACAETKLAEVHALLVRPSRSPLPEFLIYIAADVGEYVWETLLETGRDLGIAPIGLESLAELGFPPCL